MFDREFWAVRGKKFGLLNCRRIVLLRINRVTQCQLNSAIGGGHCELGGVIGCDQERNHRDGLWLSFAVLLNLLARGEYANILENRARNISLRSILSHSPAGNE